MNVWQSILLLAVMPALSVVAGMALGTAERNRLRDQIDTAYDKGWDESALAHAGVGGQDDGLTVVLSTGRGAAGDGSPALPPGHEPMIDPDCRDGKHGSCVGPPCECSCHRGGGWTGALEGRALPTAADRDAMLAELGAETERPASQTDQFQAIFRHMDGLEREVLLTWDLKQRFDRSRPKILREAGISEKRIRELLGAE